ncbi:PREDICTED: uncharacterized protein At1g24000-like [Camelina sativa]|uniref:Uncharacterized protein At1g24000-like n=1 Tax=Camelina sativa TaxID=90675 RepID=A0ABM0WY68_CAMSA|nr:PREDICTED: uncharacterized protein At1g24000-like [Camelina sativa]
MALNESTHEFDVKSQADDLFKDFMKALKDNEDEVEIEAEDWEKREITINVISSDFLRKYKTYKVTATITPRDDGDGSRVKWTVKVEKIPEDIHVGPHISININSRTVEFYRKSPAEELFKSFMEAVKDDDEVEIEAEDWTNRKTTVKLISSYILRNYKTLKITIVVTPSEDGDGSHVKWTVVFEKISDDIDDPYLAINTAAYLIRMIDAKVLK